MISKAKAHPKQPIRLLVVDDSALTIEIVRRMLAGVPEIELVGAARSGQEALELFSQLDPDVICTDYHMPGMDGIELTSAIMGAKPKPILIVSASVQPDQTENIFRMLEAGAVDILAKPEGGMSMDYGSMGRDFVEKIKVLSGVKVMRRRALSQQVKVPPALLPQTAAFSEASSIVAIGSSTGGPQALERILRSLPKDFPLPIVCVQHITDGFISGLVGWLASTCKIGVTIARDGEEAKPGVAYFAPDDAHLEVNPHGRFELSPAPPVGGHRPSIDHTFSNVAKNYGASAVGVLLTGMGRDGAEGLLDIRRSGGFTIAQDEASSIVFGMPKRAVEIGAALAVLPLESIAWRLMQLKGQARHE